MSKVFVGNIPYDCTQDEFESCFDNSDIRDNIMSMVLIMSSNSSSNGNSKCKGIGFITLDSKNAASIIISKNDIYCKGRQLRFTKYKNDKQKSNVPNIYIKIDGIPSDVQRSWVLENINNKIKNIKRCYIDMNINTGELMDYAIIEIDVTDVDELNVNKLKHTVNYNSNSYVLTYSYHDIS